MYKCITKTNKIFCVKKKKKDFQEHFQVMEKPGPTKTEETIQLTFLPVLS